VEVAAPQPASVRPEGQPPWCLRGEPGCGAIARRLDVPAPREDVAALAEYGPWRERIAGAGGPAALQDEIGALERSCTTLLAEYQPGFIPGLLQTPAYMREMADGEEFLAEDGITPDQLGKLIAAKVRRASILYEGGRRIVHVIGEAALRTRIGKIIAETMRDQLAHLAATALIPDHTLEVIPLAAPSPIAPASGFVIYDSDLVVIETLGGRPQVTEPELIARYHRWLELLLDAAVTGPDVAEFCRRIADELQDDTTSKPVTDRLNHARREDRGPCREIRSRADVAAGCR
jgi:hypothetical protein